MHRKLITTLAGAALVAGVFTVGALPAEAATRTPTLSWTCTTSERPLALTFAGGLYKACRNIYTGRIRIVGSY